MKIRNQTVKVASIFWVLLLAIGPVAIHDAIIAQDSTNQLARDYTHGSPKTLIVDGVRIQVEIPPDRGHPKPQLLAESRPMARVPASVNPKIESHRH